MDADDIDEALSDLGVSSIQSSPPAEEIADGSNTANRSSVALFGIFRQCQPGRDQHQRPQSQCGHGHCCTGDDKPTGSSQCGEVLKREAPPEAWRGTAGAAAGAAHHGRARCELLADGAKGALHAQLVVGPAAEGHAR